MADDETSEHLRDEVEGLRAAIAGQTVRLERLDAFNETMFSRVERAVRIGLGDAASGPAALSATDREQLDAVVRKLDALDGRVEAVWQRVAETPTRPEPSPTELAVDDRGRLDAIAQGLEALAQAPAQPTLFGDDDRQLLQAITSRLDGLADRVDGLARQVADTTPPSAPGPTELAPDDRGRLDAMRAQLDELTEGLRTVSNHVIAFAEAPGPPGAGPALEEIGARLQAMHADVDALQGHVGAPAAPAGPVGLAPGDRRALHRIAVRLDQVEKALTGRAALAPSAD